MKGTSEDESEKCLRYLENILKSIKIAIYYGPEYNIDEARNIEGKYLADNVKWILDYESKRENDKMVLWSYGTIGNNYETYSIEE